MTSRYRMLGVGEPETFRCRVYGEPPAPATTEEVLLAHVMAQAIGAGLIEAPAFDAAISFAHANGWIVSRMEPNPGPGGGRVKVWVATPKGRAAFRNGVQS